MVKTPAPMPDPKSKPKAPPSPPPIPYPKKPCDECPWRTDVPVGKFTPARFIALAATSYDRAMTVFGCHKAPDDGDMPCAGAVLRQTHNLRLRLMTSTGAIDPEKVGDGGHELFENYRAMSVANGVPADHPALRLARDDV